jgi:ribosomal protein S19
MMDPAAGAECGLLVGSMKPAEQDVALQKRIVFATFPMAEEGLDDPKRDSLVLAMPKTNAKCLEQSIGRIVRMHERKKTIFPVLVDLVDDKHEALVGRSHVRRRIYEEVFGYKTVHHDWATIRSKFPAYVGPPLTNDNGEFAPRGAGKKPKAPKRPASSSTNSPAKKPRTAPVKTSAKRSAAGESSEIQPAAKKPRTAAPRKPPGPKSVVVDLLD